MKKDIVVSIMGYGVVGKAMHSFVNKRTRPFLKLGVDYNNIREAVFQDDLRMSPYWTFVYPNSRGFATKCIPKDIYAIVSFAKDMEVL